MPWARVYSDDQRTAIERAAIDDKITPLGAIAKRAEAGELRLDGQTLEPFKIPAASVRDIVRRARLRRAGRLDSALAQEPVPTQIDIVRRRLMSLVDHELRAVEVSTRTARGKPDMRRASAAAKVAREAFALTTGSVRDDPGPAQRNARQTTPRTPPTGSRGILTTLESGRINDPAQSDPLHRDSGDEGSATALERANSEEENEANEPTNENGDSAGTYIRDRMDSLSAEQVELGPAPRVRVH